jgi:hypothetical protein
MKPRALTVVLVLLAGLAAAAQYGLVQRSHAAMQQLHLRLVPYGDLHYRKLWPWLWGAGQIWDLSFEPAGLAQLNLQTPNGYRVQLRELQLRRIDPGWFDGVPSVRGHLHGLSLPVAESRSLPHAPGAASPLSWPTLHELGYRDLVLDVEFDARFIPEAELLLLRFKGSGESIGNFSGSLQLQGDAATLTRAPDGVLLRRLELAFAGEGLLQRYRETAASRQGMNADAFRSMLLSAVDRLSQQPQWTWDAGSTEALRSAVRGPVMLHARMDPPGKVLLRNLRLYRVADWGRDLGLRLGVEPASDTPGT